MPHSENHRRDELELRPGNGDGTASDPGSGACYIRGRDVSDLEGRWSDFEVRREDLLRLTGVERLVVEPRRTIMTVSAADRPGLLCSVVRTLAAHGLPVRHGHAVPGARGMAVEVIEVDAENFFADWGQVHADLVIAINAASSFEPALSGPDVVPSHREAVAMEVIVDNDVSPTTTVVKVRGPDGNGVLFAITKALADCGLDVALAEFETVDRYVDDRFYVTVAATGAKLTDPVAVYELRQAIQRELGRAA